MKKNVILLLLVAPMFVLAQIKGENSKDPYTSLKGKSYAKGDVIKLKNPSNNDKFAYVYTFKSTMSFGNIVKTVKNVNDVSNLNLKNTQGIKNAINTTKNITKDDLLKNSISSLQNKVVSEEYIKENALDKNLVNQEYKIQSFKIFTDDESGKIIVHAIAKGKKGKIAVLIDAAEEEGEI